MSSLYCTSSDGTRIAYDTSGTGPALVLLHGMGKTRDDWHNAGYVSKLESDFQVITIDMRGTGESDRPVAISDYSVEKLCDDILSVGDTCRVSTFAVCGYDFGGNVARYLAARSDRVTALVVMGVPFGPAVHTSLARKIDDWVSQATVASGQHPHLARESPAGPRIDGIKDKDTPIWLACFQAMRSYPVVQPGDIHCPALLIAGSENTDTVNWVRSHQTTLRNAGTRVEIVEGLDHIGEFTGVESVLPAIDSFLHSVTEGNAISPQALN